MISLNQLFQQVKVGDDAAFEEIVKKMQPLLIKAALRSGTFDEDCYQECLIALYKAICKFEVR